MKRLFKYAHLSLDFFKDYPQNKYPEIERKPQRPHIVLLVKVNSLDFAIPLRNKIRHLQSFFTNTNPDGSHQGLDYSKAVIVSKANYITDSEVFIAHR